MIKAFNKQGSVFVVTKKGQTFKGAGYTSIYGSIGEIKGKKILSTVASVKPTAKNEVFFQNSRRGYMTLGSILGNGRFRDRGVPEEVLFNLLTNRTFLKRVKVAYKMQPIDEENLVQAYEPILSTQSLQQELSKVKSCVIMDANGLTGTFKFGSVAVRLNASEVKKLKAYI